MSLPIPPVMATIGYALSSALAGAYVGVVVVCMVLAGGLVTPAASPWIRLCQYLALGIAVALVSFAGSVPSVGSLIVRGFGLVDCARGRGWASELLMSAFAVLGNVLGCGLLVATGYALLGPRAGSPVAVGHGVLVMFGGR